MAIIAWESYKTEKKTAVQVERLKDCPKQIDLLLVKKDLDSSYTGTLSTRTKDRIIEGLDSASREFRVPVMFLHALSQVESNYQFNVDHPLVTVDFKGKKVQTRARGLNGIIWLFWADSLIANHIAEVESDLYIPFVNIRASAFIIRTLINQEKGGDVITRVTTRYFGAYSKTYETKMRNATSKLWMEQIEREMEK
jgi:hypothetical protein